VLMEALINFADSKKKILQIYLCDLFSLVFWKTTFTGLWDTILLSMTLWTLFKRSTVYGARKKKVSNAIDIKICCLSKYVFSCLAVMFEAVLWVACPTNSTQAWFLPTHQYIRTSADWSVDILSCGSVKKFTGASFLIDTHA
jgi:hypothetical protein